MFPQTPQYHTISFTFPTSKLNTERESERGNEGTEDADPRGGDMGSQATPEGQGVFGGGVGHDNAGVPANGRPRPRQPFRRSRGRSRPRNLGSHLQAHQGEDMRW